MLPAAQCASLPLSFGKATHLSASGFGAQGAGKVTVGKMESEEGTEAGKKPTAPEPVVPSDRPAQSPVRADLQAQAAALRTLAA